MPKRKRSSPSKTINNLLIEGVGHKIFKALDTRDKLSFVQLNQESYRFFKPEREQLSAKALLQFVVYGDEKTAKALLDVNPSLLLIKSEATDYSGRKIIATALQAALGAGDKRMWEMMIPYFETLERNDLLPPKLTAKEVMLLQFNEQFPKGLDMAEHDELIPFYSDLAQAIIDDEHDDEAALIAFRDAINNSGKKITTGHHFNLYHLIAAHTVFIQYYYQFEAEKERDTFWVKVIGYLQRQVPAHIAQTYCSNAWPVTDIYEFASPFRRTFELYDEGTFFPLKRYHGLGIDYAVSSFLFGASDDWFSPDAERLAIFYERLCAFELSELGDFKRNLESPPSHWLFDACRLL